MMLCPWQWWMRQQLSVLYCTKRAQTLSVYPGHHGNREGAELALCEQYVAPPQGDTIWVDENHFFPLLQLCCAIPQHCAQPESVHLQLHTAGVPLQRPLHHT